jgi:PmbA protein
MTLDVLAQIVRKAEKEGASEAEAFFCDKSELQIRIKKKQVKIGEQRRDIGVGIRVAVKRDGGTSLGFSYTTDFTDDALDKTIKQAIKMCFIREPEPDFKGFSDKKPYKHVADIYDKNFPEIQPEEVIELAGHQIELASADNRVEVINGLTSLLTNEIAVTNSHGIYGSYKASNFYSYIYVLAKETGSSGVGWNDYSSCFYDEDAATKIAQDALDLALHQLHPKPIKGETMDLIMAPDAFAKLLIYTFIQELRADMVQKRQSPLAGKLNQKIASEILTMVNDGYVPKATGSRPFDDEGVPSTRVTVVDKGILKSFLYHTYAANKEGVESTGNALRYALLQIVPKYKLEPFIGPNNLVVKPGTVSKEEIISEVKNGILTKDFIGAHTSSSQSGNFSIAPYCAFKVEDGEIRYPVKEAMIGGDILTLLKNVKALGNDVKQVQYYDAALVKDATLIAPTVLVKDVSVSA